MVSGRSIPTAGRGAGAGRSTRARCVWSCCWTARHCRRGKWSRCEPPRGGSWGPGGGGTAAHWEARMLLAAGATSLALPGQANQCCVAWRSSLCCMEQLAVLHGAACCVAWSSSLCCMEQLTVLHGAAHCVAWSSSLCCMEQLTVLHGDPFHTSASYTPPHPLNDLLHILPSHAHVMQAIQSNSCR